MSTQRATDTGFDNQLRQKAQLVNNTLQQLLAQQTDIDSDLKKAIDYTLQGKGKRIRAALLLWCCELVSGKINQDAEIAAAAIEMVHTYSLVHDDLPAMDNDDLRRGLPTCHKAFDEATAILTGDALLTLAFEVLANRIAEPAVAVKLISQLAEAAGPTGMIAGQVADLKAENGRGTQELLEYIHTKKTAKMFQCAAAMGAIAGQANDAELKCLSD
jgi:geranylgeranyl diphosphate synthase type II